MGLKMKIYIILQRFLINDEWTDWKRGWHRKWYDERKVAETALNDSTNGKKYDWVEFKIIEIII